MQTDPLLWDHPVTEESVNERNARLEWFDQVRGIINLLLSAAMVVSALAGAVGERGQSKARKSLNGSLIWWPCFGTDDDSPPSISDIDLMFTDLSRSE